MSQRTEQMNEVIRRELAPIIQRELGNIGIVTIIDVFTSPDLSIARIWVSKPEKIAVTTLKSRLSEITPELQRHLNKRLSIKKVPKVILEIDTKEEEIEKIERIIDELDHEV